MKFILTVIALLSLILIAAQSKDTRQKICASRPEYGHCKGHRELWYFNIHRRRCEKFIFSNCGGNQNRFFNKDQCMEFCTTKGLEPPK